MSHVTQPHSDTVATVDSKVYITLRLPHHAGPGRTPAVLLCIHLDSVAFERTTLNSGRTWL